MKGHQYTLSRGYEGLLEQALDVASSIAPSVMAGPGEFLLEATDGRDDLGGPLQL